MEFSNQFKRMNVALLLGIGTLVLYTVSVLISLWKNRRVNAFMAKIPGPISIPFIGNVYCLLGVSSDNLWLEIRKLLLKYPTGGFWALGTPYLITGDREIFNAVLASTSNINKTRDYDFFKSHAHGIFTVNGSDWRKTRKLINPSFRTNVLASFSPNFSHHTKTFLENLHKKAIDGETFDIFVPTHLSAIDFICDNMMGCRVDVQKKNLTYLSTNLEKSTLAILKRSFSIVQRPDFVFSLLGKEKELAELVRPMRILVSEMLEDRIRHRNELKSKNMMEGQLPTFINLQLDGLESGTITKERIREDMVEMFIAGSITTATTNAWIFKLFAMRPDIQEKVYREILETCGHREITNDDLSKLVYLDMVVKEVLRLFAVPFVGRDLVEDVKVNEKTTIPAGVQVLLIIYCLHHNPDYWEKPGEFYPEHFSPSNEANRPKGAYVPFLNGPRVCLGNKYAMQSVKFLVANTILHYEFSTYEKPPQDFRDESYRLLFMLWPASGFNVQVKQRNKEVCSRTG